MQKDMFLKEEGNKWFNRNYNELKTIDPLNDMVLKAIDFVSISPPQTHTTTSNRLLEIGCSDGSRLKLIKDKYLFDCYGIDPSVDAIEEGGGKYGLNLKVGTADNLQFEDKYFNIILFGFSLYLCDRDDLFKIAYETDRILSDNGYLIINDFQPPFPYKNIYKHCKEISSYKLDYASMFKWNPVYTELFNFIFTHNGHSKREIPDERIGIKILYKNERYAYPHMIQWD